MGLDNKPKECLNDIMINKHNDVADDVMKQLPE